MTYTPEQIQALAEKEYPQLANLTTQMIYDIRNRRAAFISGFNECQSLNDKVGTMSEWQLCPKCNGQGIVSKPPYIAGDQQGWASEQTNHTCNLCDGKMVILPPNDKGGV